MEEFSQFSPEELRLLRDLETFITTKRLVQMTTHQNRGLTVFPCKVVHLEGELSLVAEEALDHCLLIIPIKQLAEVHTVPHSECPKITMYEIEEFIAAIRAMNEKEARLILKIHEPQTVNLFPVHHFLGKPCMITNPNGDLIWAAYVEPCEALYDWLTSLGNKVEILDPIKFKEEYLAYCEEKIRKIA